MNLPTYRLFILGAGFSRPTGLPLGLELLSLVRDRLRHSSSYGTSSLEQEIEEWESLYPGQEVDLERVLAYSHRNFHLRLRGSDEFYSYGSVAIVAAKRAIQQILIDETPSDTPDLYLDFARRLTANDLVLTFNYDTLLEQALECIGTPYTLTPEWWLRDRSDKPGYKYVDLLKLHGSLDCYDRHYHDDVRRWYREEGNDVPDKDPIFGPRPSVPHEHLAQGAVEVHGAHILPRVFRVPNHSNYFPIDHGPFSTVVPFILPPAYDKLLGYDPILDLWENLHRTLDIFSSIVIIGYSMPPYDSYAFEALGRLLIEYQQGGRKTYWGHRRVPVQLVTLASSSQDVLKNMPFLNEGKTLVWRDGFSNGAMDWIDWG